MARFGFKSRRPDQLLVHRSPSECNASFAAQFFVNAKRRGVKCIHC
jgi:hypothetical protein